MNVHGIPFEGPKPANGMELSGLPFRGSVKLGKGSLLRSATTSATETWKDILHKLVPHY